MPISAVSSSEAERDAWKRAAELAGLPFTAWCRDALNAAAEAEQEARDQEGQFLPRTPSRAGVRAEPVAYVPPKLPLLPLGATTSPEPVDMEAHRQRGLVGNFIRADGMEWRGGGPDPLDPRCQLRGDVLAEFVVKLQHVRVVRDRKRQEAAEMRASGVPA